MEKGGNYQAPVESEAIVTNERFRAIVQAEMARNPGRFALITCDLEDLKERNDELGHDAGDELIASARSVISVNMRLGEGPKDDNETADVLAEGQVQHAHGDEFWILLRNVTSPEDVEAFITRMQTILDAYGIGMAMGGRVHIPDEDIDELFSDSDALMYEDKDRRILKQRSFTPEQEPELLAAEATIKRITGFRSLRKAEKLLKAMARERERERIRAGHGKYSAPLGRIGVTGPSKKDVA